MADFFSLICAAFVKIGIFALLANEVRGLIMSAPVIYGIYHAGGTGVALWLGLCSLGGILLSVAVPVILAKKMGLVGATVACRGD